mgnify:FL=1
MEARRLGFTDAVLPLKNARQIKDDRSGMQLHGAETIGEALRLAMPKA